MKKVISILCLILIACSCNKIKSKAKETISKGSQTAGELASDAVLNIKDGAQKNLESEIKLDSLLPLTAGVKKNPEDNILVQYFIFDASFSDTLIAFAYNREKEEIGRAKAYVSGKANDAKYIKFIFNEETELESKGLIIIKEQQITPPHTHKG